jgi:hypothetical protein
VNDLAVTVIHRDNVDESRPARVLGNGQSAIVPVDGLEARVLMGHFVDKAQAALNKVLFP